MYLQGHFFPRAKALSEKEGETDLGTRISNREIKKTLSHNVVTYCNYLEVLDVSFPKIQL